MTSPTTKEATGNDRMKPKRAVTGRLEIKWLPGWFGFGFHDELQLLWEIHGHPTEWVFIFGPLQIIRRKPSND